MIIKYFYTLINHFIVYKFSQSLSHAQAYIYLRMYDDVGDLDSHDS